MNDQQSPGQQAYEQAQQKRKKQRQGKKTVIKVERGKEDLIWRKMQTAAIAANCPIFVRGGELVEPLWRKERVSGETDREFMTMSLVRYNKSRLTDQLIHNAVEFVAWDDEKGRLVPINAPVRIIEMMLERGFWNFPSIKGVINTPTMRADGSLLTAQGYDRQTQLWLKTDSDLILPKINEEPSKADAERALNLLDHLLDEFPFVADGYKENNANRSVALAAFLTVVLRGAFDLAPMFFIAKPEAGTGGSYFVKLVATLATGQDATPLIMSKNPEELQKELTAKVREGQPILHLNNLTFDLDSALLWQIITEGKVAVRPFHRNDQTVTVDCRSTTAFANGNNINVVGDGVRRTLRCLMDAQVERPELRTFKMDPVGMVLGDRGKYLAAVFTIARAYIAAGCPVRGINNIPVGFEGWVGKVVRPLLWLERANPLSTMDSARALDPQRSGRRERIEALKNTIGVGKEFTAREVYDLANECVAGSYMQRSHPDLFAAFSRDGKNVSSRSIGNQLMADRSRFAGGYVIMLVSENVKGANTYKLKTQLEDEPEAEAEPTDLFSQAEAEAEPTDDHGATELDAKALDILARSFANRAWDADGRTIGDFDELETELRQTIGTIVTPERVEPEFQRVLTLVYAMQG